MNSNLNLVNYTDKTTLNLLLIVLLLLLIFFFKLFFEVHVHVSLSHGENFSRVHSPAALWVHSVSTRGFEVCAREAGAGSNGTGIINWMAFHDQPQVSSGSITFGGTWTTETKCDKVTFKKVSVRSKKKGAENIYYLFHFCYALLGHLCHLGHLSIIFAFYLTSVLIYSFLSLCAHDLFYRVRETDFPN